MGKIERVQSRAAKRCKVLREKTYQERSKELNKHSLEDRRERGRVTETFTYIKGGSKILEGSIFNIKILTFY